MSTPTPADVEEYLAAVDGERGEALRAVFATVRDAMPGGFQLGSYRGAPHWSVPLGRHPSTSNGEPLAYVTLMAQRNYTSLYLMALYADSEEDAAFRAAWKATGLKLDMGRSCLRFRTRADVDLGLIADVVAATSVDDLIALSERQRPT